jgi:hypothetical protein
VEVQDIYVPTDTEEGRLAGDDDEHHHDGSDSGMEDSPNVEEAAPPLVSELPAEPEGDAAAGWSASTKEEAGSAVPRASSHSGQEGGVS